MTTTHDLATELARPVREALTRLRAGAAEDIQSFAAALSADAAAAAAAGDEAGIRHVAAQVRALGEAQRLDVAEEGWAIVGAVVEGGASLLLGLITRGAVGVVA